MTIRHTIFVVSGLFLSFCDAGSFSQTLAQTLSQSYESATNEFDSNPSISKSVAKNLGVYEVRSLREPISIDLGQINASSKQFYRLRLVNKLGLDLFPVNVSRSCNCIIANVPSENWRHNSPIEFDVRITVGPSAGNLFRQKLSLLDRNNAVAPLVLDFCGKTIEPLSISNSVIVVQELGQKAETELAITCNSSDDDLSNSTMECSLPGVNLTVKSRSKKTILFAVDLDSAAAFRGRPSVFGIIFVRDFLREGILMECPINLELKFSKIVVALPDRISFHESDGKFVGKILLHGNFNASAPQGNEVLIWASWNRESKVSDLDLEVKSTLIKPNMLSVTVFAEKQPSTQNRELHFMVGVNGAGVSVPAEFVDLKPSAGNLTKR